MNIYFYFIKVNSHIQVREVELQLALKQKPSVFIRISSIVMLRHCQRNHTDIRTH